MPKKKVSKKKTEEPMVSLKKEPLIVDTIGYVNEKTYAEVNGVKTLTAAQKVYRVTLDLNNDVIIEKKLLIDTKDALESLNLFKQEAGRLLINERNK